MTESKTVSAWVNISVSSPMMEISHSSPFHQISEDYFTKYNVKMRPERKESKVYRNYFVQKNGGGGGFP